MALFYRFSLFCAILPFSSSFIYKNRVDLQEDLKIKKISNCKAELNNGSFIDLKSLDNPSDPMSVLNDGREFLYNPCSSIECDKDLSSAVCQKLLNSNIKINCGEQNTASFTFTEDLVITYTSNERTSHITCKCSQEEVLEFNKDESLEYFLTMKSKQCCAKNVKGLSFGSIILIIFFSVLFVYVIGGFVFLKFFQKKNGIEMIPNYQFWSSLPGDIKSGISFTMSKVRRNNNSYNQI